MSISKHKIILNLSDEGAKCLLDLIDAGYKTYGRAGAKYITEIYSQLDEVESSLKVKK